jgi:hypothetical protein
MEHRINQIAEYATPEFNENRAIYDVLEQGIYTNPHGLKFECELYHRSEGYKPAGSCAIYGFEVWGYKIFWNDGTTGGKFSSNENDIRIAWENVKK